MGKRAKVMGPKMTVDVDQKLAVRPKKDGGVGLEQGVVEHSLHPYGEQ